ncbi:MAG: rhomboid family intramembrane serine protease [Nocardioides sp.]
MSLYESPSQVRANRSGPSYSPVSAALFVAAMVGLLWLIEAYDVATAGSLNDVGIVPRDPGSLDEIFTAPLLHHGWGHLAANTLPLAGLGFLVLLGGVRRWFNVTMISVLASGLAVWLFSPPQSITAGASGVVFGYFAYLLARGFFARNTAQIVLGVALFFLWGGMWLGVLPGAADVSWQGHLGGAIGGLLAAKWLNTPTRR